MKTLTHLLSCCILLTAALAAAGEMRQQSTAQVGFEYDTNVFKNFNNPSSDFLFRLLAKNQGEWQLSEKFSQYWNLQLGGKKYFDLSEQDMFIGSLEIPLKYYASPSVLIMFEPEIKYQDENNSLDTLGADINEDFLSTNGSLSAYFYLPHSFKLQLFSNINYFKFQSTNTFSYLRESGGTKISREMTDWLSMFAQYYYAAQQFESSDRADREHAVTPGLQIQKSFIFTGSYTYQTVSSSNEIFSFDNHRINLSLSVPLILPDEESMDPLLGFHLLGALQVRNYPSVFGSTQEGERFLLSGSEDENFNSITAKLTYHPVRKFIVEGKFTRYSNELSSSQVDFTRHLFYLGARYLF